MKKKKIMTFEPLGDFNNVKNLLDLRESIKKAKKVSDVDIDADKLKDEINSKMNEYYGGYFELVKYLSKLWGKYVNIKIYCKSEDEWKIEREYNVLLSDLVGINDTLFGVFSELNNPYNASVGFTGINLRDITEKHRITIEEITERRFKRQARESIEKCLKHRMDKINSDEYERTFCGYKRKNKTEMYFDYLRLYNEKI